MTTTFTAAQLATLRTEYAPLQRVSVDHLPRFRALFDKCSDAALKQLAGAKINFVSKLAVNACVRRGLSL